MENIKTYDEFVNEGLFDVMTKTPGQSVQVTLVGTLAMSLFSWMVFLLSAESEQDAKSISLIISLILDLPVFAYFSIKAMENFYHKLRSIFLLKKTSKEYKKALEYIEKYPDIESQLLVIKERMMRAVKNKDKKEISYCIHEIYEICKLISVREELGDLSVFTEKEKEKIKALEAERAKTDPFGEEEK